MKKSEIIFAIVVSAILWCIKGQAQYLPIRDTNQILISTRDAENFLEAINCELSKYSVKINYLDRTSAAIHQQLIIDLVDNAGKFTKEIKTKYYCYIGVRHVLDKLNRERPLIQKYLGRWRGLYPAALLPDVYFAVGSTQVTSLFEHGNLIINLAGLSPNTIDPHALDYKQLYPEILQQILRTQQGSMADDKHLLAEAIRTGSADFFTELISGVNPNQEIFDYAKLRENEIKEAFRNQLKSDDYSGWYYPSARHSDQLMRWIGYQITASYFQSKNDKTQAVNDILNIVNYDRFLITSGYENTLLTMEHH